MTVNDVVETVSAQRSSWGRPDVIQAICDGQRPVSQMSGRRWLDAVERSADRVIEHCVDLDPTDTTPRRASDGRSVWIEPTAPRFTSEAVLAQEEHILDVGDRRPARPAGPVDHRGRRRAGCVAGRRRGGGGRRRRAGVGGRPGRCRQDPHAVRPPSTTCTGSGRPLFGLAPTAKAARVLERDTGIVADTVAKLLYEWARPDRAAGDRWRLPAGDDGGRGRGRDDRHPALHQLVMLAERQRVAARAGR